MRSPTDNEVEDILVPSVTAMYTEDYLDENQPVQARVAVAAAAAAAAANEDDDGPNEAFVDEGLDDDGQEQVVFEKDDGDGGEETTTTTTQNDIEMSEFRHEFYHGGYRDDPTAPTSTSASSLRYHHHDQLPSVDEVKAQQQQRLPQRVPIRDLRACGKFNLTTCCLTLVLVALIVGAILGFTVYKDDLPKPEKEKKFDPSQYASYTGLPRGIPDQDNGGSSQLDPSMVLRVKLVNTIALQQGKEFEDPDSYQSRAMMYMTDRPDLYSAFTPTALLAQSYALLCLYFATNGPTSWYAKEQWLRKDHDCARPGVECNGGLYAQNLNFYHFGMTGELPEELTLLTGVAEISIDENPGLEGQIPGFLARMNLKLLSLEDCGYTGNLPIEICDYVRHDRFFILEVDCKKVMCQPYCCDACYNT